jgi:tripartite-type tricarboxylate transporter receptor subunit TctC
MQKHTVIASTFTIGVALATSAVAQSWPTKPVTIVAPGPAGGTTDLLARMLGEGLTKELKQPVIVDNKPGAGTNIGNQAVARAQPDGYTLLIGAATLAINPAVYSKLAYDPQRDLLPIRLLARAPNVVVVAPTAPASNVTELINWARSNPGKLNYASPGSGTSVHMSAELFKSMTATDIVHVPYKGSSQAVSAVLSGEAQMVFETILLVLPQVKAGKLRALAVTGATRSAAMPDIPTVSESGVAGYEVTPWFGVLAPTGIPAEVVRTLDETSRKIFTTTTLRERVRAMGADPADEGPDAFRALIRTETQKWAAVAKKANIRAD